MQHSFKHRLARKLRPIAKPFVKTLRYLVLADVCALMLGWLMVWAAPRTEQPGLIPAEGIAGITYIQPWVPGFQTATYYATIALLVCFVFFGWLYSGAAPKPKG